MVKTMLRLKPTKRARILKGHPWVFATEVETPLPDAFNGQGVELVDAKGRSLGSGIYNRHSQIIWRRYSRQACAFDRSFLQRAITKSLQRRAGAPYGRLVWSEADDLPGLVVDRFEQVLVVQALTLAMDVQLATIADILQTSFNPKEILLRNDAPTREHEQLPLEVNTLSGEPLPADWYLIDGIAYELDFYSGHKTGFYLDQREQHRKVAALAQGKRVLDAFCNQGAFALHCAQAGAATVRAIDIAEHCCALARKNAAENGLTVQVEQANVFDWFAHNKHERFDLIILDPPSFARNKRAVEGALRGYKELNLRAMKALNPGGVLATYACSQSITEELFYHVLAEAAGDAKRDVQLLEKTGQPLDHPVLLNVPETHYLKGALLRVL